MSNEKMTKIWVAQLGGQTATVTLKITAFRTVVYSTLVTSILRTVPSTEQYCIVREIQYKQRQTRQMTATVTFEKYMGLYCTQFYVRNG